MTRTCMVHQPHFLPWLGYLARCLSVDVFVVLDDVKFNRNHFQQRTKFCDRYGNLRWLSIPIERATRSKNIESVKIASDFPFLKWQRPIIEGYRDFPFFDFVWRDIAHIIEAEAPDFCAVNLETLEYTLRSLAKAGDNRMPKIIRSSAIAPRPDRTGRLVDICRNLRVTHLVMGDYALHSHDVELLSASGIELKRQHFVGPREKMPPSGLMGLHHVMEEGFESTFNRLTAHWSLRDLAP